MINPKVNMNKIRLVIFLIFFSVIGYSLSLSGLIGPATSVPDCLEDKGMCYGSTVIRIIDGHALEMSDS